MKPGFNDNLANRLYLDFCEAEGGVDHPVLEAWCKCEETFGEIAFDKPTQCIDELFHQTIKYVIDALQISDDWDNPESQSLSTKLKKLKITAPPDWNDYDEYLLNGGQLEYSEWRIQRLAALTHIPENALNQSQVSGTSSTRTDLDEYLFNSFVERWCEE